MRKASLSTSGLSLDDGRSAISHLHLVDVAPAPIFSGFEGLDDGVFGLVKVPGGMLVLRRIAATNVSAGETQPQVDPAIAGLEAVFAAFGAGRDFVNLLHMATSLGHGFSLG